MSAKKKIGVVMMASSSVSAQAVQALWQITRILTFLK